MDLSVSQQQYSAIIASLDRTQTISFLRWVKQHAESKLEELNPGSFPDHSPGVSTELAVLNQIQSDLREAVPVSAVLASETLTQPQGKNADCDARSTVHVDGFLYDEDAIDDLVESGQLSRNYCQDCGSRRVTPLTFVSHSTSQTQLQYIFQYLLQDLRGKFVLDVGSRLGPVLYGGYLYTGAAKLVGVELCPDLCRIQQSIVDKYCMQDRIKIVCDDICNQSQLLSQADVIILNNVFEFFLAPQQQKRAWHVIREAARNSGTLIVTSPSLPDSLGPLQLLPLLDGWVTTEDVRERHLAASKALFADSEDIDLDDIHVYRVS